MKNVRVTLVEAVEDEKIIGQPKKEVELFAQLASDSDFVDPIVHFGKSKFRLSDLRQAVDAVTAFYGLKLS